MDRIDREAQAENLHVGRICTRLELELELELEQEQALRPPTGT